MKIFPMLASLVLLSLVACETQQPAVEQSAQPLVGGVEEEGWLGVGALTMTLPGLGYAAPFCTATLIEEDWLLTAAHCVSGDLGMPLIAPMVEFYVGADAVSPGYSEKPKDGKLYQADALIKHPSYNQYNNVHDIALVHLSEPVVGIPMYKLNSQKFDSSFLDKKVFYVGFGVTDGNKNTGSGIKRSGWIPIYNFDSQTYWSDYNGTGVCFGDSGGPGLVNFGDEWRIIGVNSWVASMGYDPCKGISAQMRVDANHSWLVDTMNDFAKECWNGGGKCACTPGCMGDGHCNDDICKVRTCRQTLECLGTCGKDELDCQMACYRRIAPQEEETLHSLGWCMYAKCNQQTDWGLGSCVQNNCTDEIAECQFMEGGASSCKTVHNCILGCQPDDISCNYACYTNGSADGQIQYDGLRHCFEQSCSQLPHVGFSTDCGWENCAYHIETCLPPTDCSLLKSECPASTACWFNPINKLDCFPSLGGEEGQPCKMGLTTARPCADGLQCVQSEGATACSRICTTESHCFAGETCAEGTVEKLPDYGYCSCPYLDQDGFCAAAECDDENPDANPDAEEICGNQVDENCDGQLDDGCEDEFEFEFEYTSESDSSGCNAGAGTSALLPLLLGLFGLAVLRRTRSRTHGLTLD